MFGSRKRAKKRKSISPSFRAERDPFGGEESAAPRALRHPVERGTVVTLDYTITDDEDQVLDSTEGRGLFSYLHGAGKLLPALEEALAGHTAGDKVMVRLTPKQAYGVHDPDAVQVVEKPLFLGVDELQEGMLFEMETPQGLRPARIIDVDENTVTIDLNHPLAGKALNFTATIVSVRPALPEEMAQLEDEAPATSTAAADEPPADAVGSDAA